MLTKKFLLDTLERAARSAVQGYLAAWAVLGLDFDGMLAIDNLKGAGAAAVLSILMAVTLKPVQPDSETSSVVRD